MSENLQFPVQVATLFDCIPHRPPMVWIDTVLAVNETGGKCCVEIRPDAPYMEEGHMRRSSLIELMAQAYGYIGACQHKVGIYKYEAAPKLTFLAHIKNAEFFSELPAKGRLEVSVEKVRQLGPLSLVKCVVSGEDGKLLARGELKLYAQ